jgi:hypothetical protein
MPRRVVPVLAAFWLSVAALLPTACSRSATETDAPDAPAPSGQAQGNPLDEFVDKAGAYLASAQEADGSWPYFHAKTPTLQDPEPHARLFGTAITLMNLTHTSFEASSSFERGADYVKRRMTPGYVWSFYEPGAFGDASVFEPDADTTAVALTVLAGRLTIPPAEMKNLRAVFDRQRTASGLYRIYFAGFNREKGFVPDVNVPSIGVNLNVLGFLGKYEQPRASLVQGLRAATEGENYWETTPFYRSLPVLAWLASNAVEHGAPEAGELMRRFLADFATHGAASPDFAEKLPTLELAAYVKARSHACLLERSPCRELDPSVFQLARRRKADGSWDATPFYSYETNPVAMEAFLQRRDFADRRKGGGYDYNVKRALASPGTVTYFDGSAAETTSFALKALSFYRELVHRRNEFSVPANASPAAPPSATAAPGTR